VANVRLTARVIANPARGTVSFNGDGSLNRLPETGFYGTGSFIYKANDGSADSSLATVSITVTAVNDVPVAQNACFKRQKDSSVRIDFSSLG